MKRTLPSYRMRAVHLSAVWAYAVSQPVFSMVGANPEFLVVRGSTWLEILVFAVVVVVAVPLIALACELLVSRVSRSAGDVLHLVFLGAFSFPLAMLILKQFDPGSRIAAVIAAVAMAAVVVGAYARWRHVRTFLTLSIVLPVIGFSIFVMDVPAAVDDAVGFRLDVERKIPIVAVVFDEFPVSSIMTVEGGIDAIRYPNFARLAGDATWYRSTTTVHEHTTGAVPAILTGNLPESGTLPSLAGHPGNLFTLLGEAYRFNVHEPVTFLCPKRYCPRHRESTAENVRELLTDVRIAYLHGVLPRSLAASLPSIDDRWSGFTRERILAGRQVWVKGVFAGASNSAEREFESYLDEFSAGESPRTLHFVHVALPHSPWRFLPSGRRYDAPYATEGIVGSDQWGEDPWLVLQGFQRHLLQVGYTDRILGRLLDRLRHLGLYDRALVVVAADHGVSFVPGQRRRTANRTNLADIARVPLFVKLPGQRAGRVDTRPVQTIDIVPTIADVLGIRLPWAADGQSLLEPRTGVGQVLVSHHDGPPVRASSGEVDRLLGKTLHRKALLFGKGRDSLYEIGRNVRLLGATPARATLASKTAHVQLDDEEQFDDVGAPIGFVPVRVSGVLEGTQFDSSTELAIAVNGRIAALTHWFRDGGSRRFYALVPETTFRDGFNRVDVFAVEVGGTEIRLVRLGGNTALDEAVSAHG